MLISVVFNIFFYVSTFILALCGVIASLLPKKLGQRGVKRCFWLWCHCVVFLVRHVLRTKIDIRGKEHLISNQVIFASKHQSEMDVALLGTLIPDYGAIAMRELDNYPLIGRMVSQLGHIKVTTSGKRRNQLPEVIKGVQVVHAQGRPVLIFPEGRLMRIGRKEQYRHGVWHIYHKLQLPVIPVAHNLGSAWPRREWRKYAGRSITLEFLPPIAAGMEREAFMKRLEHDIETQTNALLREQHTVEELAAIEFDYEVEMGIADNTIADSVGDIAVPLEVEKTSANVTERA